MLPALATTWHKHGFIYDLVFFLIMTPNASFNTRAVLQLYVIAFCVVKQPFNWKNYYNGSACKFTFELISWKLFYENHSCILLMTGNRYGHCICKWRNFV